MGGCAFFLLTAVKNTLACIVFGSLYMYYVHQYSTPKQLWEYKFEKDAVLSRQNLRAREAAANVLPSAQVFSNKTRQHHKNARRAASTTALCRRALSPQRTRAYSM